MLTGDSTTIESALQNGFGEIGGAPEQFPESVINGITAAVGDGTSGQAAGEAGATLGHVLASLI
jgi:hypothetical protein